VTGRRWLIILLVFLAVAGSAFGLGVWLSGGNETRAVRTSPVSSLPSTEAPTPSPTGKPSKRNPFGVFFNPMQFDAATRVRLAQQLGAHYLRSYPVLLPAWTGDCFDDCRAAASAGLKYYLTIRNSPSIKSPAGPVTQMSAFRDEVARVIQVFKPAVIAVENEEDVPGFFSGTADQYLAELQAACDVAHQMHVLCSNGGLTGGSSTYLAYKHLLDTGQTQAAQDYAQRAFQPYQLKQYQSASWQQFFDQLIGHVEGFTKHYKEMGADFINFHWYSQDATALADTIRNLQDATGLSAVSNEFATDSLDPKPIAQLMQTVVDLHVRFAVWYSSDARIAKALVERQGQLRATGQAFEDFVRSHFTS
jgi:hypothetical protein